MTRTNFDEPLFFSFLFLLTPPVYLFILHCVCFIIQDKIKRKSLSFSQRLIRNSTMNPTVCKLWRVKKITYAR